MSTFDKETLLTISADETFVDNITFNFDEAVDPETVNNSIISVTADGYSPTVDINFSTDVSTVNTSIITVSGTYGLSIFPSAVVRTINRNSSDSLEEPKVQSSISDVLESEQIIEFMPSPVNSILVTYTVQAMQNDTMLTGTFTQTVLNNYNSAIPRLKARA